MLCLTTSKQNIQDSPRAVTIKPVVFSPRAERDLELIADHIAAGNPARALTFIRELRVHCLNLVSFPQSARRFPELAADAHASPHGNYVILYRDLPETVSIERVIHGARDIMALISETDD